MADNTTLNTMTGGDVIATDDVSSVKYQQVKLVDGTLNSTAVIPGDATNGLDVDVTRVQGSVAVTNAGVFDVQVTEIAAGNNNIGNVDVVSMPNVDVAVTELPALVAGTANIGDVDVASIAAGDNNIGNVDIVTLPALVAGSAAIGKLAANSGVDIGDVDVTSLPATPTGTNKIGYIGEAPGATVVTAQVVPTTTAATLVASRATRTRLTLRNGTDKVVFVGPATVTAANGFALDPGDGMELDTTALLQSIIAAGTAVGVVYVLETAA